MVVMLQYSVKIVILFHIVGTRTEEAQIKHKDVDTQGDKRCTQGQAETQKEGPVGGQVYRQRDREATVMTG